MYQSTGLWTADRRILCDADGLSFDADFLGLLFIAREGWRRWRASFDRRGNNGFPSAVENETKLNVLGGWGGGPITDRLVIRYYSTCL